MSRPDKGRGVVIVNKSHYIEGLSRIVSNTDKFEIISDDINRVSWLLEDKLNGFLLNLKKLGHISQDLYGKLHVTGTGPGILYGLAKVHKDNFLVNHLYRPIFAAYNCASYKISKFLVDILSPIAENQYTIKNSAHFREQISNMTDPSNLYMTSFDIKDLYTNIPLQETIDICLSQIHCSLLNIPQNLFRKLIELSVFNTMFAFNGRFYKQKDGLGMGLPLSPIMANIFLCYHETRWLQDCPVEYRPVFYRRYMDDTFVLFRHENHAAKFLEYLNSKHPNIMFTSESEVNGDIAFLDCLVSRGDQFCTGVYRKKTFSGQGLSFFSFCPYIFKINSIKTLLARAYRVSSTFTALNKEFSFLAEYFFRNGYPKKLVYSQIGKFIQNLSHPSPIFHTVAKRKMFISIPYFGRQSEKLKNEISTVIADLFPQLDLKVILSNKYTIGSLFKFKEPLPRSMLSSIVYKYSCAQCASGTYVGSTTRAVHMRIAEHRGRSFRTGKLLSQPGHSAIREHSLRCSKQISASDFSVLGQEKCEISLRILESLHIHVQKPSLNEMQSSFPLKIVY